MDDQAAACDECVGPRHLERVDPTANSRRAVDRPLHPCGVRRVAPVARRSDSLCLAPDRPPTIALGREPGRNRAAARPDLRPRPRASRCPSWTWSSGRPAAEPSRPCRPATAASRRQAPAHRAVLEDHRGPPVDLGPRSIARHSPVSSARLRQSGALPERVRHRVHVAVAAEPEGQSTTRQNARETRDGGGRFVRTSALTPWFRQKPATSSTRSSSARGVERPDEPMPGRHPLCNDPRRCRDRPRARTLIGASSTGT